MTYQGILAERRGEDMTSTILEQIAREIERVTAEQLNAVALVDVREDEEIIGSVADYPYIHRAWALAHDYDRRSSLAAHSVRFGGPKNRKKLIRESHRLVEIENLVRDLAWAEIRRILPQLLDYEQIGLRAGWTVVKSNSSRHEMHSTLAALRDAMGRAFHARREEDEENEEDREEKVQ